MKKRDSKAPAEPPPGSAVVVGQQGTSPGVTAAEQLAAVTWACAITARRQFADAAARLVAHGG